MFVFWFVRKSKCFCGSLNASGVPCTMVTGMSTPQAVDMWPISRTKPTTLIISVCFHLFGWSCLTPERTCPSFIPKTVFQPWPYDLSGQCCHQEKGPLALPRLRPFHSLIICKMKGLSQVISNISFQCQSHKSHHSFPFPFSSQKIPSAQDVLNSLSPQHTHTYCRQVCLHVSILKNLQMSREEAKKQERKNKTVSGLSCKESN